MDVTLTLLSFEFKRKDSANSLSSFLFRFLVTLDDKTVGESQVYSIGTSKSGNHESLRVHLIDTFPIRIDRKSKLRVSVMTARSSSGNSIPQPSASADEKEQEGGGDGEKEGEGGEDNLLGFAMVPYGATSSSGPQVHTLTLEKRNRKVLSSGTLSLSLSPLKKLSISSPLLSPESHSSSLPLSPPASSLPPPATRVPALLLNDASSTTTSKSKGMRYPLSARGGGPRDKEKKDELAVSGGEVGGEEDGGGGSVTVREKESDSEKMSLHHRLGRKMGFGG